MNQSPKSLDEQLDDWANDLLDASQLGQLRERLRCDSDARSAYVRWQMLNAALKLEGSTSATQTPQVKQPNSQRSANKADRHLTSVKWKSLLTLAAAFALCVMATRWAYLELTGPRTAGPDIVDTESSKPKRMEPTSRGIALVTRLVDAQWADGEPQANVGQALTPGRLKLQSGYAQIEFFCGASVVLEGPAELQLVSSTSADFLSGRLRAQVPPAARGFQINVEGMKVVDLGTEFGVSISPAGADVQVFDGEVELHRPNSEKLLVTAGQAFVHDQGILSTGEMTPKRFVDLAALDSHAQGQITQRYERWKTYSDRLKRDDRLIAYYLPSSTDRWKRKLSNQASSADGERDGAIVGARRVAGRWPNAGALEFKQPGDRVRVNIPGEFRSLTFACWVKIDSLDRWYNSLFLTDNYQEGEPHWQILDSGQLFFSVRPKEIEHQKVLSAPFWNPSLSGKWLHLATVYNVDTSQTTHYLNGKQLHQETISAAKLVETTRIGMASIGNWSMPTKPEEHFAIRNLNGSLDEFAIFSAALTGDEIREMYLNGTP